MTGTARRKAVVAIDHGTKRTGFAVTDALRASIMPLDVHRGPGDGDGLLDCLASHLEDREVETFVVGYPRNMDGSAGPRAAEVDAFCARLSTRFPDVQIVQVDERLSTKEAEGRLVESGYFGKARKARRDSWSAAVILEDWIRAGEPH